MAKNTPVQGGDLMIFAKTSTGNYKPLAMATSHSLSSNWDEKETSTKDSGGTSDFTLTVFKWSLETSNLITYDGKGTSATELWEIYHAKTPVLIQFANRVGSGTIGEAPDTGFTPDETLPYWQGTAMITTMNINAENESDASYTATFRGKGDLTLVKPA